MLSAQASELPAGVDAALAASSTGVTAGVQGVAMSSCETGQNAVSPPPLAYS